MAGGAQTSSRVTGCNPMCQRLQRHVSEAAAPVCPRLLPCMRPGEHQPRGVEGLGSYGCTRRAGCAGGGAIYLPACLPICLPICTPHPVTCLSVDLCTHSPLYRSVYLGRRPCRITLPRAVSHGSRCTRKGIRVPAFADDHRHLARPDFPEGPPGAYLPIPERPLGHLEGLGRQHAAPPRAASGPGAPAFRADRVRHHGGVHATPGSRVPSCCTVEKKKQGGGRGLGSRRLRLLGARLAALGGSTLPGGEAGPIGRPAAASGARASRLQSR